MLEPLLKIHPAVMAKMENTLETISKVASDARWLACLIDGEGWLGVYDNKARRHRQMKISVGNTSPQLIQETTRMLHELGVKFYYQLMVDKTKKARDFLTVEVSGNRNVYKVLSFIRPYLIAKADQAQAMLDYLDWRFQFNEKGPVPEDVRSRQDSLRATLLACKQRRYALQRLPRSASTVLDLTTLEEAMVESTAQ